MLEECRIKFGRCKCIASDIVVYIHCSKYYLLKFELQ